MDCATGLMGRATTILVVRAADADRLSIGVRRVEGARFLYPLRLAVSIPSASGGTHAVTEVPAAGTQAHRFSVELPDDIAPGDAMDVEFRTDRTTLAQDVLASRSVHIEWAKQE